MAATVGAKIRFLPPKPPVPMLPETESCPHPIILDGSCDCCGATISVLTLPTIPLRYIHRGLEVSISEMIQLRQGEHEYLLRKKRLCLVLDLDGTLLHTANRDELTSGETHLWDRGGPQNADLFKICLDGHTQRLTKLRPGVREFLKEASKMYHMYVYTKGKAFYAETMVGILDPGNKYFKSRVIAREHMTDRHNKSLDVVPVPENMVVIVDDKLEVWPDHSQNVIVPEKYCYFAGVKGASPSLAEAGQDESRLVLRNVLVKLKLIHKMFFGMGQKGNLHNRDVREMLRTLRHFRI